MDEIASLKPMFAGVNYRRMEGYKSLRWPVTVSGADEPLLLYDARRRPG
jgi:formate dehydrogenase major subunit